MDKGDSEEQMWLLTIIHFQEADESEGFDLINLMVDLHVLLQQIIHEV
jgi:hypothetical protein